MSQVNKPVHYQTDSGMEAIDVIEAFSLGFNLGNAAKYLLRAGKKDSRTIDLEKALWYIQRELGAKVTAKAETREEYFREGRRFVITKSTEEGFPVGTIMVVKNGRFREAEADTGVPWCSVHDPDLTEGRYHWNGPDEMLLEFVLEDA